MDEFEIKSARSFARIGAGALPQMKVSDFAPEKRAGAPAAGGYEFMKKPLNKVAAVPSMPQLPSDDVLEKISKKELVKLFKEFRAQLQSMENRIDNFIAKLNKR